MRQFITRDMHKKVKTIALTYIPAPITESFACETK